MKCNGSVAEFLASDHPTAFSFEILPPIRGKNIDGTFRNIDRLMEFDPAYVNITTHRTQVAYRDMGNGSFRQYTSRRRPGTVAVAAVIRERYSVATVPHIICGSYSRREIEDQLIDLSYLGINDILVLRGDKARETSMFVPGEEGHEHAASLAAQVREFNDGKMVDGIQTEPLATPFTFGVAGYPEKHEEAMNIHTDMEHLKEKVRNGASYIVTQMFFDNSRYFDFVARCRENGITVPIVPGIKPLTSVNQKVLLPRTFHIDLPHELATEFAACKDNDSVKSLGIEWAVSQARELKEAGVPSIHFYAMNSISSVAEIASRVY